MNDFLRRLPKTDIHCHLDGSLRPATVLELARERKVKMPADNLEDLTPFVQVPPTCRSLKEFLDVFDVIYPLLRDAAAVERIAYELVEDCAADNIRHVEVRFAPTLQATAKFSCDDVIEASLKGLRRGLKDFGVSSTIIVCLIRSHSPAENRKGFATLKRFFRKDARLTEPSVVALDLAGDEARFPTIDFAEFYEQANELGIRTTCHAGETKGTANLRAALDLSVMRIGHGTHLLEDGGLMKEVVKRNIAVEIGLTSNVRTKSVASLEAHPARAFYDAGVPITLNTDDRGIIGIDLTHEYREALKLGFTVSELAQVSLSSVDHLFLPETEKATLRSSFGREIRKLTEAAPR